MDKAFGKIIVKYNQNSNIYVKLQDAFVAEKGIRVGNWKEIGYLMKNSSNFYYCDVASNNCTAASNSDGYATKATINDGTYAANWQATNIATLNDCAANSNWKLTTSQNGSSGGEVLYAATVSTNCGILTPSFEKLQTAAQEAPPKPPATKRKISNNKKSNPKTDCSFCLPSSGKTVSKRRKFQTSPNYCGRFQYLLIVPKAQITTGPRIHKIELRT